MTNNTWNERIMSQARGAAELGHAFLLDIQNEVGDLHSAACKNVMDMVFFGGDYKAAVAISVKAAAIAHKIFIMLTDLEPRIAEVVATHEESRRAKTGEHLQ